MRFQQALDEALLVIPLTFVKLAERSNEPLAESGPRRTVEHGIDALAALDPVLCHQPGGNQPLARCRKAALPPAASILTQDGAPLAAGQAGEDVHLAGGQAWVEVDRPKMYNLVVNPTVERHILRLRAATPGVAVYAFTFVTCVRG